MNEAPRASSIREVPPAQAGRYRFDPASLDEPRPAGISALLRVRNGADFLRLTIESHLPFYDEIVACYNDCTDDTEEILHDLARRHPGRVRPIAYAPKVHPALSPAHDATPTDSVHSLANYYNFALAQARYAMAVKLDDDHLAIPGPLARVVARIRTDLERGERRLYTFSGINLAFCPRGTVALHDPEPFAGTGDIMYFPVRSDIHWRQAPGVERLDYARAGLIKEYAGLLFFHLKYLKPDLGFGNFGSNERIRRTHAQLREGHVRSLAELCDASYHAQLRRRHGTIDSALRTNALVRGIIQAVSGRNPPLRICRLERLAEDLGAIDWQRDLADRLPFPVVAPGTPVREHFRPSTDRRPKAVVLADA